MPTTNDEAWEAYLREVPKAAHRSPQGALAYGYDAGRNAFSADELRDTIARAVWRYQMCPGTFDQPAGEIGALAKNLCIDEAENIRRAIMGEPQLTDGPQADDDVVF